MNEKTNKKTTVLFSVPGFGLSTAWQANAISAAKTTSFDELWRSYQHFVISSPYQTVAEHAPWKGALPYRIIDSGKSFVTNKSLVDRAISHQLLDENKMLKNVFAKVLRHHGALHLIGNISKNAEFGDFEHLLHIIQLARKNGLSNILVHVIADNTYKTVKELSNKLEDLQTKLKKGDLAEIASVVGQQTLLSSKNSALLPELYFENKGKRYLTLEQGLAKQKSKKPAELSPFIISKNRLTISDFDGVILFNHTFDQLASLLPCFLTDLPLFSLPQKPKFLQLISLFDFPTIYAQHLNSIFKRDNSKTLSGKLSKMKKKQLLICDLERKTPLSYYFAAGNPELAVETVDRARNKSKSFSTALSKHRDLLLAAIKTGSYDLICFDTNLLAEAAVLGDFDLAKDIVEILDELLAELNELQSKRNFDIIFISPFGQAEKISAKSMDEDGLRFPTENPVPAIYISEKSKQNSKSINSIVEEIASEKHDLTLVHQILCDSLGL